MQKKIIAVAVAGLMSSAAFAADNVTIYGKVDEGYKHVNLGSASGVINAIDSGIWTTSRLGFKGEEDLGDGMKAMFNLEYGLAADSSAGVGTTAAGVGNARQQMVGLSGNFGSVAGGYLQTPAKYFEDTYAGMDASALAPANQLMKGGTMGSTINSSSRLANAAAYTTPNMSGFTGSVYYSFAGGSNATGTLDATAYPSGTTQERVLGLAANYDGGPLTAGLIYHRARDLGNTVSPAVANDQTDWALGVGYNFGVATVRGLYAETKDAGVDAAKVDPKLWSLSADIPATTQGTVYVAYAHLNADITSADASSWALGYKYTMSKRTFMYAGYMHTSNDSLATQSVFGASVPAAGVTASGYAFGLAHVF